MKLKWKIMASALLPVGLVGLVLAEEKPVQKAPAKPVSSQKASTAVSSATPAAASDFLVIGYLEKRDRTITIKSGPKGPVYSVKAADGKLLFENLSAEELRAKAPELHEFIKSAVAGKPAVVDASAKQTHSYSLSVPDAGER